MSNDHSRVAHIGTNHAAGLGFLGLQTQPRGRFPPPLPAFTCLKDVREAKPSCKLLPHARATKAAKTGTCQKGQQLILTAEWCKSLFNLNKTRFQRRKYKSSNIITVSTIPDSTLNKVLFLFNAIHTRFVHICSYFFHVYAHLTG